MEEYRRILIPEVREAIPDRDRADAVLSLAGPQSRERRSTGAPNFLQAGTSLEPLNAKRLRSSRLLAFKWTFAEFEGARELYAWSLLARFSTAYKGITAAASRLPQAIVRPYPSVRQDHAVPGPVSVTQGNAG